MAVLFFGVGRQGLFGALESNRLRFEGTQIYVGEALERELANAAELTSLKRLYDYWRDRAGDTGWPSRDEIDPTSIDARDLPHVCLIDVESDPKRFRFRLVGTSACENYGRDYTGEYLDDLNLGVVRAALGNLYESVVDDGKPRLISGMYLDRRRRPIQVRRFAAPMTRVGGEIDMLFCGVARAR